MNITVDCSGRADRLRHFWTGTGFTPATLLLRNDMRQTIAHVGSLPNLGIKYVRPHYLLDLVAVDRLDGDKPWYDFTVLYEALDVLIGSGLKPVFELMGNPSGRFTNFGDEKQLYTWKDLVCMLAQRLITRYGQDEVESWYFETWNEPDCEQWWYQWPRDERGFCNYYDACSEGLGEAHASLRLGGPGTCRTLSSMFKAFLAHCDTGRNYFTGKKGVRLDFISVHEKGAPADKEDRRPDSRGICRRETRAFEYVRENHPRFAGLEFMNNECDPQTGWADPHEWRGGPYYAALAAKIVAQHCHQLVDEQACRYALLSNDNGFLGRWGHRTQLARFGSEGQLAADRFDLVKKPVLNVLALLGLLGEKRLAVTGPDDPCGDLGAIAALHGDEQAGVLVYHSSDEIGSAGAEPVSLAIEKLPFERAMLAHYRIDEMHCNPQRLWAAMGRPDQPTQQQLTQMREHQEPGLLAAPAETDCPDGRVDIQFDMPLPAVSLLLLSAKPPDKPRAVTGLRAVRYRGLHGQGQIMLSWTALDSRVLAAYTVLCATDRRGPYRPVSPDGLISSAFLHTPAPTGRTYYRIRAVDYWGRTGPATNLTVP